MKKYTKILCRPSDLMKERPHLPLPHPLPLPPLPLPVTAFQRFFLNHVGRDKEGAKKERERESTGVFFFMEEL
jgi:hypothetical protein